MNSTSRIVSIALIALFAFLALYFGIKYNQLKHQNQEVIEENDDLTISYNDLNNEFTSLKQEFEILEDSTLVLNEELEQKRQDLVEQKNELEKLFKSGKLTKSQLEDARLTIATLREDKSALLTQIQQLQQENLALKEENKNYSLTLNDVSNQKQQLEQQNQNLASQKTEIESQKSALEEKVKADAPKLEYGQVVAVKNIQTEGVRYRNSGKEVSTKNSDKVDKIKVNFTSQVNPVTPPGELEYIVRIISPNGTVIYDEQRGSGTFRGSENNEGMKYTTKTSVDYEGQPKNISLFWRQDYAYPEGTYQVEVYNRGFLVGSSNFELR